MKKKDATILIAALTSVLGIVCYFALPDVVAVQWSSGKIANTLPKVVAILISYGLTALLLLLSYAKNKSSYTVYSLIGAISLVLFLIMN